MSTTLVTRTVRGESLELHADTTFRQLSVPASPEAAETERNGALIMAVRRALRATGYAVLRHVTIEACRGEVALCGSVSSFHLKQVAQVAALQVAGIRRIINGIDVIRSRP